MRPMTHNREVDRSAVARNNEAGNVLFFTALGLVVLMGFAGLAIDGGMMRYQKRLQQTAADAAAIAAANDLAYGGTGSALTTIGQSVATANGYTGSGSGNCVTGGGIGNDKSGNPPTVGTVCVAVNNPPSYLGTADPHNGDSNYVEVVVAAVHPTYFMGFVHIYQSTIVARAEATDLSGGTSSENCMYTLGPPASEIGVDGSGSAILNVAQCGIIDNGNFDPNGAKYKTNACSFGVDGANDGNSSGNVNCNGNTFTPTYGMPTKPDPFYGDLTAPTSGTATAYSGPPASCSTYPCATYSGVNIPANATVTFPPGVYVIDGGGTGNDFSCGSNSTVNAYGVVFYFKNGATVNCQGGVTMNIGAPCSTSGCACSPGNAQSCYCPTTACPSQYAKYDIVMWQDASDTNTGIPSKGSKSPCPPPGSGTNTGPELGGSATSNYWGVLYFPSDQLYLTGTSGATMNIGTTVSDTICLSGNATINMNGSSGMPKPIPSLTSAILVE